MKYRLLDNWTNKRFELFEIILLSKHLITDRISKKRKIFLRIFKCPHGSQVKKPMTSFFNFPLELRFPDSSFFFFFRASPPMSFKLLT